VRFFFWYYTLLADLANLQIYETINFNKNIVILMDIQSEINEYKRRLYMTAEREEVKTEIMKQEEEREKESKADGS
jgi:hypothetical protein